MFDTQIAEARFTPKFFSLHQGFEQEKIRPFFFFNVFYLKN